MNLLFIDECYKIIIYRKLITLYVHNNQAQIFTLNMN